MKKIVHLLFSTTDQVGFLIGLSRGISRYGLVGKYFSISLDSLMLTLYGIEVISRTLNVKDLQIGHTTGVCLGGNGIRCTGKLHVASGVVFGRRYVEHGEHNLKYLFEINGDLTVGANAVILGPIRINGPVIIQSLSLVTQDTIGPGIYAGNPAKLIKKLN